MKNGTEEQIARAEKGGREEDGRSNGIRAIMDEIKAQKDGGDNVENRTCSKCGRNLSISEYYFQRPGVRRTVCKTCYNSVFQKVKSEKKCAVKLTATADEMEARLYDDGRAVVFTEEDLLNEIRANGEEAISTLHTTCIMHKELLDDAKCVEKVNELISELIESMKKIAEVKDDEKI